MTKDEVHFRRGGALKWINLNEPRARSHPSFGFGGSLAFFQVSLWLALLAGAAALFAGFWHFELVTHTLYAVVLYATSAQVGLLLVFTAIFYARAPVAPAYLAAFTALTILLCFGLGFYGALQISKGCTPPSGFACGILADQSGAGRLVALAYVCAELAMVLWGLIWSTYFLCSRRATVTFRQRIRPNDPFAVGRARRYGAEDSLLDPQIGPATVPSTAQAIEALQAEIRGIGHRMGALEHRLASGIDAPILITSEPAEPFSEPDYTQYIPANDAGLRDAPDSSQTAANPEEAAAPLSTPLTDAGVATEGVSPAPEATSQSDDQTALPAADANHPGTSQQVAQGKSQEEPQEAPTAEPTPVAAEPAAPAREDQQVSAPADASPAEPPLPYLNGSAPPDAEHDPAASPREAAALTAVSGTEPEATAKEDAAEETDLACSAETAGQSAIQPAATEEQPDDAGRKSPEEGRQKKIKRAPFAPAAAQKDLPEAGEKPSLFRRKAPFDPDSYRKRAPSLTPGKTDRSRENAFAKQARATSPAGPVRIRPRSLSERSPDAAANGLDPAPAAGATPQTAKKKAAPETNAATHPDAAGTPREPGGKSRGAQSEAKTGPMFWTREGQGFVEGDWDGKSAVEFKECPACAERIRLRAIHCRFCGHSYAPADFEKEQQAYKQLMGGMAVMDPKQALADLRTDIATALETIGENPTITGDPSLGYLLHTGTGRRSRSILAHDRKRLESFMSHMVEIRGRLHQIEDRLADEAGIEAELRDLTTAEKFEKWEVVEDMTVGRCRMLLSGLRELFGSEPAPSAPQEPKDAGAREARETSSSDRQPDHPPGATA